MSPIFQVTPDLRGTSSPQPTKKCTQREQRRDRRRKGRGTFDSVQEAEAAGCRAASVERENPSPPHDVEAGDATERASAGSRLSRTEQNS
eukprot:746143-Hanusia_phi.AAC.1